MSILSELGTYLKDNRAVKEFASSGSFPATGKANTVYVDKSTDKVYYWDGSAYTGIDAETFDGLNSTQFVRSDANDTITGQITLDNATQSKLEFAFGSSGKHSFTKDGEYLRLRTDDGSVIQEWRNNTLGSKEVLINGSKVWTAGNDGSGSGLDADLLDGQQGSYYQPVNTAVTTTTQFSGDVSGTYDSIVIADDSHNHIIENVDGLQSALDSKVSTTSKQALHATDALSLTGNILYLNKADGTNENVDLSLYLDDTNLSRIISGTYDSGTQELVFTRDDDSEFRIDASMFFDDTNLVTSVAGKTGAVTLVKGDVGLGNVDNTADAAKNVLSATKLTTARTISLSGDASGSITFDGSSNVTIPVVIADDSHNHTIANVDGLQTALDGKLSVTGKATDSDKLDGLDSTQFLRSDTADTFTSLTGTTLTATNILATSNGTGTAIKVGDDVYLGDINEANVLNIRGSQDPTKGYINFGNSSGNSNLGSTGGSNLTWGSNNVFHDGYHPNADKLTNARTIGGVSFDGTANINLPGVNISGNQNTTGSAAKLTTARTIALSGDVSGSVSFDGSANATITATVADDSHNHIIANIDGLQTSLDNKVSKVTSTDNAIVRFNGTTGDVQNSSVVIDDSGRVGIGTTTPASTLDVNGTVTANGLSLGDDNIASFGAGNDLQIYHQGSTGNNKIDSTGNLFLKSVSGIAGLSSGLGQAGVYVDQTSTRLYHVGSIRLQTATGGVTVTGEVTTTGGNSTNWNTAYGWGNHALAGYVPSSSYTASDVLTKIKTVDGSGSGLDADTLDGMQPATTNTAATIVQRDSSGNFSAGAITANLNGTATNAYGLLGSSDKNHLLGESTNWDAVGFTNSTNLHFQGHNQFWVGAGNGTWFAGTANTKNQSTGLAADASYSHDLLVTTMQSTNTYDRGITFAVDSTGAGNTGWRLGKWHSGDAKDSSKLVIDGGLFAKGGYTDEYDYYGDDYSAYYSSAGGGTAWNAGTMNIPSITASTALMIQSGNKVNSTRKPQLQFHQYGYGGPTIEYDGPNKRLSIGDRSTGDYFTNFTVEGTGTFNGNVAAPTFSGTSLTIGAGVTLGESADRADLLEIKSSTSGWGGIQITNTSNEFKWSFMGDGTTGGIYDDLSNAWHIQFSDGGGTRLYQAGAEKLTTTTTGVSITGTITESSDKRLKENIKPLNDSLNKVLNLQGVEYNLIEQPGKTEIGFIAQEVQEIVPELVETNENDMLSVSYQRTVALLVEAMKEQQEEINKLKTEINNLKGVN